MGMAGVTLVAHDVQSKARQVWPGLAGPRPMHAWVSGLGADPTDLGPRARPR